MRCTPLGLEMVVLVGDVPVNPGRTVGDKARVFRKIGRVDDHLLLLCRYRQDGECGSEEKN